MNSWTYNWTCEHVIGKVLEQKKWEKWEVAWLNKKCCLHSLGQSLINIPIFQSSILANMQSVTTICTNYVRFLLQCQEKSAPLGAPLDLNNESFHFAIPNQRVSICFLLGRSLRKSFTWPRLPTRNHSTAYTKHVLIWSCCLYGGGEMVKGAIGKSLGPWRGPKRKRKTSKGAVKDVWTLPSTKHPPIPSTNIPFFRWNCISFDFGYSGSRSGNPKNTKLSSFFMRWLASQAGSSSSNQHFSDALGWWCFGYETVSSDFQPIYVSNK